MRRTLSTLIAVALLCGLGLMAALASPLGGKLIAASSAVSAAQPAAPLAEPDAPLAGEKFNMIALPLDSQDQFTAGSLTWNANGLAGLAGTGTRSVSQWNATSQSYETWNIDPVFGNYGTNFALQVGHAYLLQLGAGASDLISFVGDVPPQSGQPGAVQFSFASGTPCKFNQFSLPLDRSSVTSANQLAGAIGSGVASVSQWNAASQSYSTWNIDPVFGNYGTDFATRIGYPYVVCLGAGSPSVWP